MSYTTNLKKRLQFELDNRERIGTLRKLRDHPTSTSTLPPTIDFSSNDYLGLARDPHQATLVNRRYQTLTSTSAATNDPILGATGSRLLSGNSIHHTRLEHKLSRIMYYRAKHHPSQTPSMREAMKIYETWLEEYNRERRDIRETSPNSNKGVTKKRRRKGSIDHPIDGDGDAIATKMSKTLCLNASSSPLTRTRTSSSRSRRSELESDYKTMFNITLPEIAKAGKWPIHLNHCLMRVALDAYWQCCWYEKLDQKKGALKSMTVPQIENVILVGERMAAEGKDHVSRLNQESLVYRGKCGPGGIAGEVKGRGTQKRAQQKLRLVASDGLVLTVDQVSSRTTAIASSLKIDKPIANNNANAVSGEVNENALLQVQRATTGRASCRGCKEKIAKGEYRVGMKVWSSGREITVWHHPICFLGDDHGDSGGGSCGGVVRVEKLTKGSTAKCKYTGGRFAVGDLRLVLEVGVTKSYYHALAAIGPLLGPVYDVLPTKRVPLTAGESVERSPKTSIESSSSPATSLVRGSNIRGLDQLNRNDCDAILASLRVVTPRRKTLV